jgi:hypothetical protein
MKTTVTLYIDIELAAMLAKEKNKSYLINSYLRNYYGIKPTTDKQELRIKADEAREMAAVFEAKIDQIESTEPERKEVFL